MVLVNPDNRPLPAGWIEHYDASSCTWYYVCTNIRPPQVSTTHPLGPPPEVSSRPLTGTPEVDRSNELTFPVAETTRSTSGPPSPRSFTVQPKASKLSFAQQLYASAAKPSQTYTPPSITIPSIPTPPSSPPPNSARQAAPHLPDPPLSSGNKYASSHHSPSDFHHPAVASQHPQSQHSGVLAPSHSLHSPPSHHSFAHHATHRAQSYQPPQTSYQQNSGHHRASTYAAGMMSKPKATPSFTTTLRPPPNRSYGQSQKKSNSTPALQTVAVPPPHVQLQHAPPTNMSITAPVPSYPSPPNSTSPTSILNASGYPFQQLVAPAPTSPPQFVHQNSTMQTHATAVAPQQQQQQPSSPLGQALGGFAMGMAGGALSAALSTQQGASGAIGEATMNGALADNNDFINSNIGTQYPNANSQFQAALQVGQPVAEYQSLLNSPVQPTPGVNYQALVTQLQPNAQQQYLSPAAGQNSVVMDPGFAAYNAQLQASQQQYSSALNAQAQQMNAAAAQEAAQAQQAQALLQAYQQQQLQVQQQQQALHHQQALQQQLLQQQLQQMHAAIGQQPAQTRPAPHETPLGTFLTGFGQALSSLGDSGTSADAGATASDDGGGVLSFFTDLAPSE